LSEIGAGITLAANAMRAYAWLGLDAAIDAISYRPARAATKDFATGVVTRTIDLSQGYGPDSPSYPIRQAHRADLHAVLAGAVRAHDPEAIVLGHELSGLTQDGAGVTARFANGQRATGAALVGCDGNRSAVREALFGPGETEFLNYVAWRGLVPADRLPDGLIDPDTGVFFGPDRSFVRYKLRSGRVINYVAFARTTEWTSDSWMVPSTVPALSAAYADAAEEVRRIIAATPPEACFKWGLIGRAPLARWTVGRATLLGDAAHAMLPFLGQGAGMAIEDAIILARALDASASMDEAFARYEAARIPRTTLVTQGSRHAGLKMHGVHDESTAEAARGYTEAFVAQFDPVTAHV
jgi:salicylate hydroxylase